MPIAARCSAWLGGMLHPLIKCIYNKLAMTYDPQKRKSNLRKHEVDLAHGYDAFDLPMVTREDDREDYGEQRFVSLGLVRGKVTVLVWVDEFDEPRIISCRQATRHEIEAYYRHYPKV